MLYERFKNLFSNAKPPAGSEDHANIDSFLFFLIEGANAEAYRDELLPKIEAFKAKSRERQQEELPGLYLYIEKYIFKSADPDLGRFRENVGNSFKSFIGKHSDFQIIFLPYEAQVTALCNRFLRLVSARLVQFLGDSPGSSWGSFNRWLNQYNPESPSRSEFKATLDFTRAAHYQDHLTVENYIPLSLDFFRDIEKRFTTEFILRRYNEAYDDLAVKFRNLDAFNELIRLFPNKTLDESKLSLLSIQEIKQLLIDKVTALETLSAELRDKNAELEEKNAELNAQSDLVSLQNKKLQEAQELIEAKNQQLSEYNQNLESIVAKRTLQLEEANDKLKGYTLNLEEHAFAISHHVKAPVARILGLIYLLNNHPDEIKSSDVLDKLEDSVNELNSILAELVQSLNIKREASEMIIESCDLSQIITMIVSEFRQSYRLPSEIQFFVKGQMSVITDRKRLTQALQHIVDNSFKFRSRERALAIEATISAMPNHVEILVHDNGVGFPFKLVREKVFSPFQRFNIAFPGKGMGLYFAKELIAVLDGTIRIDSTPERGTDVNVTLPLR